MPTFSAAPSRRPTAHGRATDRRRWPPPGGGPEPTVREVDPRLRELMGVFRRPQRPGERLSDRGITLNDGENVTLSRSVDVPGLDQPVYVWPARDAVCHASGGFGSCPGIGVLEERGVAIGSGHSANMPAGTVAVSGVARDGVAAIVFTMADGRTVRVPVVENVFYRRLCGKASAAVRVDTDGSRHPIEQPLTPLVSASADCDDSAG